MSNDLTLDQALSAFATIGFDPRSHRGTKNTRCPNCSKWRRKKTLKCVSVRCEADEFYFRCFHCDFHGSYRYDNARDASRRVFRSPSDIARAGYAVRNLYGYSRR